MLFFIQCVFYPKVCSILSFQQRIVTATFQFQYYVSTQTDSRYFPSCNTLISNYVPFFIFLMYDRGYLTLEADK